MKHKVIQLSLKSMLFTTVLASAYMADLPLITHAGTNATYSVQQANVLKGKVVDVQGEPVIGATIKAVGQNIGAVTDLNGDFIIDGFKGGFVSVTYVGYKTQMVKARAGQTLSITLRDNQEALDEVIVVGYGTQRKLTTTGAVTKVEGSDLGKMTVTNTSKALEGISPGITVMDRGGAPGNDDPEIYLRGVSTTGYSKPLVLVDGIEMPMSQVPASEIDNISILKDAASAAIYGSRAANGVILITTKRGKVGRVSITYNGYIGTQDRAVKAKAVSAREYCDLVNEALINSGGVAKYADKDIEEIENGTSKDYSYTNWPDQIFKSKYITQHTISMNGGSNIAKYLVSLDYLDQPGLTSNTDFKRYSWRMNNDLKIGKFLRMATDFTFRHFDRSSPEGLSDAQYRAWSMNPTTPLKYPNGEYRLDSQDINPVSYLDYNVVGKDEYNLDALYGQIKLDFEPIKDLVFTGVISLNGQSDREKIHYKNHKYYAEDGVTLVTQRNDINSVKDERNNSYEMTYRFLANYKKKISEHSFGFLFGAEQISYRNYYSMAQRKNLISDDLPDVSLGSAGSQYAEGYPTKWGINSFFGRFNYNYLERYLFEANIRSDGSSRFAKGHKWGTFPSFSAAWRISEEPFMKSLSWIDNLKFRASWGQTGNEHIAAYQYLPQYVVENVVMDGNLVSGVYQSQMANPNITWETVEQTDIGLDFGFLNNTIYGSLDWYIKDTKNILLTLGIPHYIGLNAPEQNAGKVRNSGLESVLGYRNTFGGFKFDATFNFSYNKNEWKDRGSDNGNIDGWTIQSVGHPLNAFYIYKADGLIANDKELQEYKAAYKEDPRGMSEIHAGDVKLVDVNKDHTIDPNDRVICN